MRHTETPNGFDHASIHRNLLRVGWMLAVIGLPTLLVAQLPDGQAYENAPTIELDKVRSGELLWKSERGLIPLPIADVQVELTVTGVMTHGKITQRFHNPANEVIEAVFAFPLPDRSAVHHMEMRIGERRIVSNIREKEEARKTYERAKETGRKATLLNQHRPNLFTTSVANINPDETVVVVLEYYEEADYREGRFSLRFPLAFTPRYAPPGSTTTADARWREREAREPDGTAAGAMIRGLPLVSIRVLLRPGFPLESVDSDSHTIELSQRDDALGIDTHPRNVLADRDFQLSWVPKRGADVTWSVFSEERDGERFAMVMLLPPVAESENGMGLATETLFVVDVSGSMAGPSIEQARAALLAALERLRPDDRFNLLAFNNQSWSFSEEFEFAEAERLEAARRWVHGLNAGGGTMIYPALMRGLELMGLSSSSHAQRIVFLTDGAVANEQEVLRALAERLGAIRLHTVGIGSAPNAYLMRKMARFGHGLCEFISDTSRAGNRIDGFLARIDRPVMEDIALDLEQAGLEQVYPRVLPDLYAGEPLLLSARFTEERGAGAFELGGYTRSGWRTTRHAMGQRVPENSGVALRWARTRVGSLMDTLHEGADPAFVRGEVVDLALSFRLVTRYTSLVAVEEVPTALATARNVGMSAALPVGGTENPLKQLIGSVLGILGLAVLIVLRKLR